MIHDMQLVDFAFRAIAKGEKTYELRLNDEKRRQIRVGDRICFSLRNSPHRVTVRVKALLPFEDFHKLYAALPLRQCGYSEEDLPHARPKDMERFYSPEDIRKWGVLAIEIERENAETARHYDRLIEENNDPVWDPPVLKEYMDRWDGEEFLALMKPSPSKRVLEIGVGSGRLALRTAPLWKELWGIDLSLSTVERAQENLSEHPNVKLICGDFLCYDFPCTYDCIYSSLTFLHIENKQEAIQKAAMLLTEGGELLLSLDKGRERFLPSPNGELKIYPDDPDVLIGFMKKEGLSLVTKKETEAATLILAQKKSTSPLQSPQAVIS